MKKLIAVCLSALLCAALLTGCGGGLSDAYDEDKVISLAHAHLRGYFYPAWRKQL